MKQRTNEQLAMHVSLVTILENIVLSAFKLLAGVLAHSGAMLSDAVHSLSDVLTTVVVMVGVKLSGRAADDDHPYGHERLECVAAILLAVLLGATGLGIGWSGIVNIRRGNAALVQPGALALVAAAVSIVVKEAMYWYTRAAAKKIHSGALLADAWHHRSDALSSVGSFVGILGARLGLPVLDPVASVVICIFIVKAAVDVFRDAVGKMTDRACPDEVQNALRDEILSQEGVLGLDLLRTRCFGDKMYVDIEIQADGGDTLMAAHETAERVHDAVEAAFPAVKHCMVHVNPGNREDGCSVPRADVKIDG